MTRHGPFLLLHCLGYSQDSTGRIAIRNRKMASLLDQSNLKKSIPKRCGFLWIQCAGSFQLRCQLQCLHCSNIIEPVPALFYRPWANSVILYHVSIFGTLLQLEMHGNLIYISNLHLSQRPFKCLCMFPNNRVSQQESFIHSYYFPINISTRSSKIIIFCKHTHKQDCRFGPESIINQAQTPRNSYLDQSFWCIECRNL